MYAQIFKSKDWYFVKYDGRKREFRGISKSDFHAAVEKHTYRMLSQAGTIIRATTKTQIFKESMAYFATIPYVYSGDGLDDYNHYQRPASNGVGYVDICPGEPGNNYYVDEPHLVAALKRKYNTWKANR